MIMSSNLKIILDTFKRLIQTLVKKQIIFLV